MTVDPTIARSVIQDELHGVVTMLATRFPERSLVDIEWVVTDVYQRLSGNARVRAHLIPLTLNRCRRLLSDGCPAGQEGDDGRQDRPPTAVASRNGASLAGAAR
jgi:hypothetical protein